MFYFKLFGAGDSIGRTIVIVELLFSSLNHRKYPLTLAQKPSPTNSNTILSV